MACQRGSLSGDAFHQISIADQTVGIMVNDFMPMPVIACCQKGLGYCHSHSISESLAKRPGGGFHAWGRATFGVTGGFTAPLAELFNLFKRQIITGKVEQTIKQDRPMAGR